MGRFCVASLLNGRPLPTTVTGKHSCQHSETTTILWFYINPLTDYQLNCFLWRSLILYIPYFHFMLLSMHSSITDHTHYIAITFLQLEVFVEHIPRAERLQDTVQLQSMSHLCRCTSNEQVLSRILCLCMAISKAWEWPLTVYTTTCILWSWRGGAKCCE